LDINGNINVSGGYRVGGTAGTSLNCSSDEVVKGATVSGGIVTGGSCGTVGGGGTLSCTYEHEQCFQCDNVSCTCDDVGTGYVRTGCTAWWQGAEDGDEGINTIKLVPYPTPNGCDLEVPAGEASRLDVYCICCKIQ
jgi:hypothetical protein